MTSSNRSRRSLASRSRHSGNHRRTDNRPYRLKSWEEGSLRLK